MTDDSQCLFCSPEHTDMLPGDLRKIACPRCKKYEHTYEFFLQCRHIPLEDRALLAGYTRECDVHSRGIPRFTTKNFKSILQLTPHRVADKAFRLLANIERMSQFFGDVVTVQAGIDYTLAYAKNPKEFLAFTRYLAGLGFIDVKHDSDGCHLVATAKGIAEIERRQQSNLDSDFGFVAMWFSPEMKPFYEDLIAKGIEDAGYRSLRVDAEDFNGDVVDEIMSLIRQARFVVTDVTGHRNGVYFEAGFALGRSLPVIWLCREDHVGKTHFDAEHFNQIRWERSDGQLRKRLANRILATVGRGPHKFDD